MSHSKLPPMLRPVSTFITRIPDPGPPICLLNASMQVPDRPPHPKSRFKTPRATQFPRALLRTLKCKVKHDSPQPQSPQVGTAACNLRYPHVKRLPDGPLTEFDKYVKENGKVKRVPDREPEIEGDETVEDTISSYRGRINVRPDMKPLQELEKQNKALSRTLHALTRSLAKRKRALNTSGASMKYEGKSSDLRERRKVAARPQSIGAFNLLDHNKQVLYNVKSTLDIPRKDVHWQRSIRQSPQQMHHAHWVEEDTALLSRTVSSSNFKRLFVSTSDTPVGSESLVVVRYPYCRTCLTHSSPIRLHLT